MYYNWKKWIKRKLYNSVYFQFPVESIRHKSIQSNNPERFTFTSFWRNVRLQKDSWYSFYNPYPHARYGAQKNGVVCMFVAAHLYETTVFTKTLFQGENSAKNI